MIYNRHARELAKGRALSPLSRQYGSGRVGHDKRGEQSARHATTTTRDTRDEVRGQRRAAHGDATLIRDVSPLVLFGLFMHACMGGVARPPAYTARRAGAPTAQQLCLPWKTTNLALTR